MPGVTSDNGWHLDKRVPLGIIAAIFVQTAILGYFIGSLDNRVAQLETAQVSRADERDRLITLETQIRGVYDTLIRIERRLERRLDADEASGGR